jgi:hypothetical protein
MMIRNHRNIFFRHVSARFAAFDYVSGSSTDETSCNWSDEEKRRILNTNKADRGIKNIRSGKQNHVPEQPDSERALHSWHHKNTDRTDAA